MFYQVNKFSLKVNSTKGLKTKTVSFGYSKKGFDGGSVTCE